MNYLLEDRFSYFDSGLVMLHLYYVILMRLQMNM